MCAKRSQPDSENSSDPPPSDGSYQRRSLLKSALGLGAASAVAGCQSGGDDGTTRDSTTDPGTMNPTETPPNTTVQQAPSDGVTVVPPGGDIQAALDENAGGGAYAQSPWGVVRLQAGENYEVSETIEMPLYSVLDFNGARMEPTGNIDVVDASAGSRVVRPYINTGNVDDWDSTVIKVTTRVKKVESIDPVYIEQMYLRTPEQQGTGVKIIDANGEGLWAAHLSGIIQKAEIGIHLRAEGEDSWVNSCYFDGLMRGHKTAILMDSDPEDRPVNAHNFNVTFQPSDTEWFWDMQRGNSNKITAIVWDSQYIEDGTIWRIGENAELDNVLIDEMGSYQWDKNVVENKFDGPNGASGNALFNWSVAQNHMALQNTVDDLLERVEQLESQ